MGKKSSRKGGRNIFIDRISIFWHKSLTGTKEGKVRQYLTLSFLKNNLAQKLTSVCFAANTLYRFTTMVSIREARFYIQHV
jgi:hypothetical protein